MSPPRPDDVGKLYEQGALFCSVGEANHLRVLIPLAPKDFRILDKDLTLVRKQGKDLDVSIRVKGMAERTWKGTAFPRSPSPRQRTSPCS